MALFNVGNGTPDENCSYREIGNVVKVHPQTVTLLILKLERCSLWSTNKWNR